MWYFQESGKTPSFIELFIMAVNGTVNDVLHCFRNMISKPNKFFTLELLRPQIPVSNWVWVTTHRSKTGVAAFTSFGNKYLLLGALSLCQRCHRIYKIFIQSCNNIPRFTNDLLPYLQILHLFTRSIITIFLIFFQVSSALLWLLLIILKNCFHITCFFNNLR